MAGKQRLLAATQSGNVLLFDVPEPDAPSIGCSDFMTARLASFSVGSEYKAHPVQVRKSFFCFVAVMKCDNAVCDHIHPCSRIAYVHPGFHKWLNPYFRWLPVLPLSSI